MGIPDWSKTAASNTTLEGIGVSNSTAPTNIDDLFRAMAAAIKEWQEDLGGQPTSSGTNTITLTTNAGYASYTDGDIIGFTAGGTNTGATTLNVDLVGAQDVKKYTAAGLVALAPGDIKAGGTFRVKYESTNADWILLNPTPADLSSYYSAGGTDVALADGGTGASTASGARTNLGLVIGTDVQAQDAVLDDLRGLTLAQGDVLYYDGTNLQNLGPGTDGQFLKTQGAAANPVWAAAGPTVTTPVATTSGITVDLSTSIPSGTTQITINFSGVSLDGSAHVLVRIGDSGGFENTGYVSGSTGSTTVTSTSGFLINTGAAGVALSGSVTLTLLSASTNTWAISGDLFNDTVMVSVGGVKSLSATLDRVQLASSNGTDAFDAGSAGLAYQ